MSELRKNWAHRRTALRFTLQLAVMLAAFWGASWLLLNGAYFVYFQLDLGRYWWVFLVKEIIKLLLPVLAVLWLGVGTVLITGWVFCKPLRYLDEVTEAAGRLARPGEDLIRLRPQLKTVQDQLNQAREQGLRAAAALRQEEQRKNDLIVYLAKNRNIALSREKLLDAVWKYDYSGDERTVDTHIKMLRHNLGEKYRKHIVTVRGMGYKFEV